MFGNQSILADWCEENNLQQEADWLRRRRPVVGSWFEDGVYLSDLEFYRSGNGRVFYSEQHMYHRSSGIGWGITYQYFIRQGYTT